MPFSSSIANIITAFASLFTAFALVIGALTTLHKAKQVIKKVDGVHTIVNQQRTDMQRYIRAQSALLKEHGIDPPIDQSIDDSPGT